MVKGRRVQAVACETADDCCSPHPKRRGPRIDFDPKQSNPLTAFFQETQIDLTALKSNTDDEEIIFSLMASEEVDIRCDVPTTPVAAKMRGEGVLTPHRIELQDEKVASKKAKPRRRLINDQEAPKDNYKVTDYFPVRRSVRKTKKTVMEEKQRTLEEMLRNEVEEGLEVRMFGDKGRGVVTSRPFTKGDFVVEYRGDLIDINEAKRRELKYAQDLNTGCYMYYFRHNNQQYCVDATAETGRLGRLVNHSRNGNLVTRTIMVDNKPRLVLIAKDDIKEGEEVTYDYGDRSKESLKHHPWLAY